MTTKDRPLAPHLQVYRPQFTMVFSIFHRIAGVALTAGSLLLVYWLLAAAAGPESYDAARGLIGSWIGRLLLFGWSFALFYHLLNGIRHLAWDAGWGFDLRTAAISGWLMALSSVALTLVAWVAGYAAAGAWSG